MKGRSTAPLALTERMRVVEASGQCAGSHPGAGTVVSRTRFGTLRHRGAQAIENVGGTANNSSYTAGRVYFFKEADLWQKKTTSPKYMIRLRWRKNGMHIGSNTGFSISRWTRAGNPSVW